MTHQKDIDIDLGHEKLIKKYPLYEFYYTYLIKKYNKADLFTKEVIPEIHTSYASFNERKKDGTNLPCYKQNPDIQNAKIFFPIPCVALYLAKNLVKTL